MKRGFCNITIDIETWGGPNKPTAEDIEVPGQYKKPESIAKYIEEKLPTAWKDQALDSLHGEIIAIGLAMEEEDVEVLRTGGDERALLEELGRWLGKYNLGGLSSIWWVGSNITGFDLPWLLHRSWKYKMPFLTSLLPTYKYDEHIVDIQLIFSGTSDKRYKTDYIAKYLGLKGKGDFDGSMVHDAYVNGEMDKIVEYCRDDVWQEREIAKMLKPEIW